MYPLLCRLYQIIHDPAIDSQSHDALLHEVWTEGTLFQRGLRKHYECQTTHF